MATAILWLILGQLCYLNGFRAESSICAIIGVFWAIVYSVINVLASARERW